MVRRLLVFGFWVMVRVGCTVRYAGLGFPKGQGGGMTLMRGGGMTLMSCCRAATQAGGLVICGRMDSSPKVKTGIRPCTRSWQWRQG